MRNALRRKTRTHTGAQADFFCVSHQRRFALQYEDKLVLLAVPMQQGRLTTRGQFRQIHAEVLKSEEIAERPLFPPCHTAEERFRIGRGPGTWWHGFGFNGGRSRRLAVAHSCCLSSISALAASASTVGRVWQQSVALRPGCEAPVVALYIPHRGMVTRCTMRRNGLF